MDALNAVACASFDIDSMVRLSSQIEEVDLFSIAERFDSLFEQKDAKKQGAFYTPRELAQVMIKDAFASRKEPFTNILDPCCGSGIFLISAYQEMVTHLHISPQHALEVLYGIDRDSKALRAAQLLTSIYALKNGLCPDSILKIAINNIRHGNALISPTDSREGDAPEQQMLLDSFSWEAAFPSPFAKQGGFDLIIGNPPYGLSRSQRISPLETELLKELYLKNHRGRINTYLLFILRSYSMLAPQGVLSFVVPNAWLGIDEARTLRKLFLEAQDLCRIDTFEVSPFKKLGVEVITFIIRKNAQVKSLEIHSHRNREGYHKTDIVRIAIENILKDPHCRISLVSSDQKASLIEKIESAGLPLKHESQQLKASIGLQAYAKGRGSPPQSAEIVAQHPFHSREKMEDCQIPYLEGKEVRAFSLNWGGQYLRYGPWLAECPPLSRYQTPRILIREILGSAPRLFQAVVTDKSYACNRSILQIHPLGDQSVRYLKALATILNSSLAGFWLAQRGRKAQRKLFPKIVVQDLNDFPIPKIADDGATALADLYDQIAGHRDSCSIKVPDTLLEQVDVQVENIYQINFNFCALV